MAAVAVVLPVAVVASVVAVMATAMAASKALVTAAVTVVASAADVNAASVATVAVNEFIFKQPVRVGDILSFFSHITRVGNTSVTVQVEVFAERFSDQGRYVKVTEATLTYVAIDANGRPRPLPKPQAPAQG